MLRDPRSSAIRVSGWVLAGLGECLLQYCVLVMGWGERGEFVEGEDGKGEMA